MTDNTWWEELTEARKEIERLQGLLEDSLSGPYAKELGRQVDELELENEQQQADIDKLLAERQGWTDEIEQLRALAERLARGLGYTSEEITKMLGDRNDHITQAD